MASFRPILYPEPAYRGNLWTKRMYDRDSRVRFMMNFAGDSTYNTLHKSNQDQAYLEKYSDKKNVYIKGLRLN